LYKDPISIGLFALGLALVGFVATSCWGFGGNIFRNSLRDNYRWFNWVMAGLLVYTAIASLV
jgi:threonine/homoserine/homoserine lactone efflux protein